MDEIKPSLLNIDNTKCNQSIYNVKEHVLLLVEVILNGRTQQLK